MSVMEAVEDRVMTALDRCDRCRAQAYYIVTMPSGSELTFCGHHFARNETKLREISIRVSDQSEQLTS